MNEIITISGIDCYEKDGTVYLRLEAVKGGEPDGAIHH